jgi:hemoglobin-like flavoprotein
MTSDQIKLVKKSWKHLMAVDPVIVGDAFYSKLFADHPGLRKLFPKEMNLQYKKLIDMLSSIIMTLDHPEQMSEELSAMGERHVGYGVMLEHYDHVGTALMWTLSKAIGHEWDERMEEAWRSCYREITEKMLPIDNKIHK